MSKQELPVFRYHPHPVATGSVVESEFVCRCCREARGYIYTALVYGESSLRNAVCPWCIADGSAAQKFDIVFSDEHPLAKAGIAPEIREEVTQRTPGFVTWQQEVWLTCCNDACEFHGDAARVELKGLEGDTLSEILRSWSWSKCSAEDWRRFVDRYQPGGEAAVYKFMCRHCGKTKYGLDLG